MATTPVMAKLTETEHALVARLVNQGFAMTAAGALTKALHLILAQNGMTTEERSRIEKERAEHKPRAARDPRKSRKKAILQCSQ